jgi:hypothetical protein
MFPTAEEASNLVFRLGRTGQQLAVGAHELK